MGCSENIQVWKIVPFSSLDLIARLIIKTFHFSLDESKDFLFFHGRKQRKNWIVVTILVYTQINLSGLFRTRHHSKSS